MWSGVGGALREGYLGCVMRPEPVKNREMSWPLSASLAICSAVMGVTGLSIFFTFGCYGLSLVLTALASLVDGMSVHNPHLNPLHLGEL